MNATIADLMSESVMTLTPHQSAGHVRELMTKHQVHSFPVLGPDQELVGIVTSTDLLDDPADASPVSALMARKVYTVPQYGDPSLAARIMRNHGIHHVVVTHEQKVVGMVSSFDLLALVEDHRFAMRNAPDTSAKRVGKRKRSEAV